MKIEHVSGSITMSPGLRPSQILANNDQKQAGHDENQAVTQALWGSTTLADTANASQQLRKSPSRSVGNERTWTHTIMHLLRLAFPGLDGCAYVLEDASVKAPPSVWGRVAVNAFDRHVADCIVAETNFGGAMVESVVRAAAADAKLHVRYKEVKGQQGQNRQGRAYRGALRNRQGAPCWRLPSPGLMRWSGGWPNCSRASSPARCHSRRSPRSSAARCSCAMVGGVNRVTDKIAGLAHAAVFWMCILGLGAFLIVWWGATGNGSARKRGMAHSMDWGWLK